MSSTRQQDLKAVIAQLQKKFGANAIHKGSFKKEREHLSTSFPRVDALIGGGIVRGNFTELLGKPTSGMTTMGFKIMAATQQIGDSAVYIDLASAFDPSTAHFCGVNIPELALLRYDFETSVALLFDLVVSGLAGVIVFNTLPQLKREEHLALAQTINRLMPLLNHSKCALVVLTFANSGRSLISQYANLRLRITFDRILMRDGELKGYQSVVTVLKHKTGNEGRKVPIQIVLDEKIIEGET